MLNMANGTDCVQGLYNIDAENPDLLYRAHSKGVMEESKLLRGTNGSIQSSSNIRSMK